MNLHTLVFQDVFCLMWWLEIGVEPSQALHTIRCVAGVRWWWAAGVPGPPGGFAHKEMGRRYGAPFQTGCKAILVGGSRGTALSCLDFDESKNSQGSFSDSHPTIGIRLLSVSRVPCAGS